MKCIARKSIFLLIFTLQLFLNSPLAYAICNQGDFEKSMKDVDIIFKGRLTASKAASDEKKQDPHTAQDRRPQEQYNDYDVIFSYKGHIPAHITVVSLPAYQRQEEKKEIGAESLVQVTRKGNVYTEVSDYCRAITQEKLDNIQATQDGLDEMIKIFPSSAEPYLKKIAAYELYDDAENIVQIVEKLHKSAPSARNNPAVPLSYGRALYNTGKYNEALKILAPLSNDEARKYKQLSLLYLDRTGELNGQKLHLSDQTLQDVTFKDIDLSGADFSGATLTKVKFINTTLTDANFSNAQLSIDIDNSQLERAKFSGAKLNGQILASIFDNADFSKTSIHLRANTGNSFKGANFSDSNLTLSAPHQDTEPANNDFTGAQFTGSSVKGISKTITAGADFSGAKSLVRYSARNRSPTLANEEKKDDNLDLSGQSLSGTEIERSNFSGTLFKNAQMQKASLRGTDLNAADFTGADLQAANFSSLRDNPTRLAGANFTNAKLDGALFGGATFDCTTQFPTDFDPLASGLEPLDTSCIKKPSSGIISYTRERYETGGINVCYGIFHADCIYSFLIGHALSMPDRYPGERILELQEIAKTLLNGGEKDLALTTLYRAYAEHNHLLKSTNPINNAPKTMNSDFYLLMGRAGMPIAARAAMIENPYTSTETTSNDAPQTERAVITDTLTASDSAKAYQSAINAVSASKDKPSRTQKDILLKYADLFLRIDGPLTADARRALDQQLRTARIATREGDGIPLTDFVTVAKEALAENLKQGQAPWVPVSTVKAEAEPVATQPKAIPFEKSLTKEDMTACPADWSLSSAMTQYISRHATGGVMSTSPLASERDSALGNMITKPLDALKGRDSYVDPITGYIDIDGITFASVEIMQMENKLANTLHILATGLSTMQEEHLEINGDETLDTVYLDGCLNWDAPQPISTKDTHLRYIAHDNEGGIAAVDIQKGIIINMLSPEKIARWKTAIENYKGIPYTPDLAFNIAKYESWLSEVTITQARAGFDILLAAMRAQQLPTEFLRHNRFKDLSDFVPNGPNDMVLENIYMPAKSHMQKALPKDATCRDFSTSNFYVGTTFLYTAQTSVNQSGCPTGPSKGFFLSDEHDVVNGSKGYNIYFTGAGNDQIYTDTDTDIIILNKGWGKQVIQKSCNATPQGPYSINGTVSRPRSFGGLGLTYKKIETGLLVKSVIAGQAAESAGIKPDDIITKIDDNPVVNMSEGESISAMRGVPGTRVKISYKPLNMTDERSISIERKLVTTAARPQAKLTQPLAPIDYKWPYKYLSFIVFGKDIKPEDIVLTDKTLTNKKTGDQILFPGGACFNLAYSDTPSTAQKGQP